MAEKRLLALLLPAVVVGMLLSTPVQAGGRSAAPGDLFVSRLSGGEALVEWYNPDGSRDGQSKPRKALRGGGIGFDSAGHLYVTDSGAGLVVKYAPDQCTLYYRSGRNIRRFDACQGRQRGDFAELRGEGNDNNRAIRILPAGEVLVADQAKIIGLDRSGQVAKDYDIPREDQWYHLGTDPGTGGKFSWGAGGETGKVYRFNLRTGGIDRELSISNVSGIAVRDAPPPPPEPRPTTIAKFEGSEPRGRP